MKRLTQVWNQLSALKRLFGLEDFQTHREVRRQKWLTRFFVSNIFLLNFLFFWNSLTSSEPIVLQIYRVILWTNVITVSLYYFLLKRNKKIYENCLEWCEKFHVEWRDHFLIRNRFEDCAVEATKIFRYCGRDLPCVILGIGLIETTVHSAINGRFEVFFPVYLPFVSDQVLLNRVVSFVNQCFACAVLCAPMLASFGVIFVTVRYAMAAIDAMKILLKTTKFYETDFQATIKAVVDLHCDVIKRLDLLINLSKIPILFFEIASYSLLLLIWVIVFFAPSLISMIFAASGEFVIYFLICWMNEQLADAFVDLKLFLYDLKWYDLTPRQRKLLLQIMVAADRPQILQAGPFHMISYESLCSMLNRAYSYGVVINNIVDQFQ